MDNYLEKLINEHKELGEKINSIGKEIFNYGLNNNVGDYDYQFALLSLQRNTMISYRQVLVMRIADLRNKQ